MSLAILGDLGAQWWSEILCIKFQSCQICTFRVRKLIHQDEEHPKKTQQHKNYLSVMTLEQDLNPASQQCHWHCNSRSRVSAIDCPPGSMCGHYGIGWNERCLRPGSALLHPAGSNKPGEILCYKTTKSKISLKFDHQKDPESMFRVFFIFFPSVSPYVSTTSLGFFRATFVMPLRWILPRETV